MGAPKKKKVYMPTAKENETARFVIKELQYAYVPECYNQPSNLFYIVRVNLKTDSRQYMRVDPTKDDSPRASFREYESWEKVFDLYGKAKDYYETRKQPAKQQPTIPRPSKRRNPEVISNGRLDL